MKPDDRRRMVQGANHEHDVSVPPAGGLQKGVVVWSSPEPEYHEPE